MTECFTSQMLFTWPHFICQSGRHLDIFFVADQYTPTQTQHTRADQCGHYNRSGGSKSVSHETQLSIITLSQLSIKPNCLTAAPGPSPELCQTLARMVRIFYIPSSLSPCHTHTHTYTILDSRTAPVLQPNGSCCVCFCDCITRPPVRVYPSEYLSATLCWCLRTFACVCCFSLVIPAHKSI